MQTLKFLGVAGLALCCAITTMADVPSPAPAVSSLPDSLPLVLTRSRSPYNGYRPIDLPFETRFNNASGKLKITGDPKKGILLVDTCDSTPVRKIKSGQTFMLKTKLGNYSMRGINYVEKAFLVSNSSLVATHQGIRYELSDQVCDAFFDKDTAFTIIYPNGIDFRLTEKMYFSQNGVPYELKYAPEEQALRFIPKNIELHQIKLAYHPGQEWIPEIMFYPDPNANKGKEQVVAFSNSADVPAYLAKNCKYFCRMILRNVSDSKKVLLSPTYNSTTFDGRDSIFVDNALTFAPKVTRKNVDDKTYSYTLEGVFFESKDKRTYSYRVPPQIIHKSDDGKEKILATTQFG